MGVFRALIYKVCRIIYNGGSRQHYPKFSSTTIEYIGGVAVFAGLIAVVYAALLIGCAVDHSCSAIFMEPIR